MRPAWNITCPGKRLRAALGAALGRYRWSSRAPLQRDEDDSVVDADVEPCVEAKVIEPGPAADVATTRARSRSGTTGESCPRLP